MHVMMVLLLATAPLAQTSDADQEEIRQRAINYQKKADKYFQAGKFKAALKAAKASYKLLPSARTAFNVALIQVELGDREDAFDQLIAGLNLDPSTKVRSAIEQLLGEQGRKIKRGWVVISSLPGGAGVKIDGVAIGKTPTVVGTAPGPHSVELELEGYPTAERQTKVRAGQAQTVEVSFEDQPGPGPGPGPDDPDPATGEGVLAIRSEPAGATIVIDGKEIGRAPVEKSLSAGRHEVVAKLDGYENSRKTAVVFSDDRTAVTLALIKGSDGVSTLQIVGGVTFGTGVLAAVGGVISHVLMWDTYDRAFNKGEFMTGDLQTQELNHLASIGMLVGYSIGALAMTTGVVLWFLPSE